MTSESLRNDNLNLQDINFNTIHSIKYKISVLKYYEDFICVFNSIQLFYNLLTTKNRICIFIINSLLRDLKTFFKLRD